MTPDAAPRPTVAIVCFGDLAREPRVDRQVRALRDRYRIVGIGFEPSRFTDVEFHRIGRRSKSAAGKVAAAAQLIGGFHDRFYWSQFHVQETAAALARERADVIIAHDIDTLPAVVRGANGARILVDAHDFSPRQFEDRLYFRLFFQRYADQLCRRFMPKADAMITVCDGLADAFTEYFGSRPAVVTNAPDFVELTPAFRGADAPIRLVHHGAAIRSRHIEKMIEAMSYLDARYTLDLFLVENSAGYVDELRRLAAQRPGIAIRPPVPMHELPRMLNAYDAGVFLLEPVNFNYQFALPNKLFEYVQARLGIVVSPSVEMARLVRDHGCGVVASDFSPRAFAAALAGLDHERINALKARAHEAAHALSSERNMVSLREMVARLAGAP